MRLSFSNTATKDRAQPHTISLKLRDTNQLFNSMDPSPFIEKDLDDDAEEFIVSWAQEFPPNAAIKLRIHLDQWPAEDPQEMVVDGRPQPFRSSGQNHGFGVQAPSKARPHQSLYRDAVLGGMSIPQQDVVRP